MPRLPATGSAEVPSTAGFTASPSEDFAARYSQFGVTAASLNRHHYAWVRYLIVDADYRPPAKPGGTGLTWDGTK
jgi:hypothetical protein